MARHELQKVSKLFVGMPTKEFLARLVRTLALGASTVVIGGVVEKGPEDASKNVLPDSEVVGVGNSESNVVQVKDRERKRHRDRTSSRALLV